jgi:hypothetical protein
MTSRLTFRRELEIVKKALNISNELNDKLRGTAEINELLRQQEELVEQMKAELTPEEFVKVELEACEETVREIYDKNGSLKEKFQSMWDSTHTKVKP